MERLRNVVVGIDGSAASVAAVREAVRASRADGATVHALHVVDELVVEDLDRAIPGVRADVHEQVLASGRALVGAALGTAKAEGVRVEVEVSVGDPADVMLRRAKEIPAGLVVLGAAGAAEGLGSVAFKVVRGANTRVLIVREGHQIPWKRVVACVDLSPASRGVLEEAVAAALADGAALDVLHAYAPPWEVLHYRAPTKEAEPGFRDRYVGTLRRLLQAQVDGVVPDAKGLKVQTHLVENLKPSRGVVEFLQKRGADLAVVGTRGRSRLAYFVVGTTAERILREAPCSVLAVKSS